MGEYLVGSVEYHKQYYKDNKERIDKQNRIWFQNNPEKHNKQTKQWAENNPEKRKETNRKWYKNNLKKIREYQSNRQKIDLKYNINHRMRTAIGMALKGNKASRKWENLVGYTLDKLIKRLKETLPKGYTWQDYLEGKLHIDHIVPKSIFNYTKSEHMDFKRCWALTNLQLLPARENLVKRNYLINPFQPALKLEVVI